VFLVAENCGTDGRGDSAAEPLSPRYRASVDAHKAGALRLLAVSDLPEDAWQVALVLVPTFEGAPDELVAVSLAATSAPAR